MSTLGSINASIIVGTVNQDDTSGLFKAYSSRIYTDYLIRCKYEKDRKRYMLGLTSPNGFKGKSCAFVQLAAPTLLLIVDWTGASLNEEPEVPDPDSMDSNWVLLDDFWEPNEPVLAADGISPLYRISGTYIYGKANPQSKTYMDVTYPRPPWLLDSIQRVIPSSLVTGGLVVASNSSSSSSFGNVKGN